MKRWGETLKVMKIFFLRMWIKQLIYKNISLLVADFKPKSRDKFVYGYGSPNSSDS